MKKKGLLLINLGTPTEPSTRAVRAYLKVFLSDPCVFDVPAILRFILLRCIILPTRSSQSARAYQKIWMNEGSPLMVHSVSLQKKIQKRLGDDYVVELAMRYGHPSIASALSRLNRYCEKILIVPLFPQFSLATNISVEREVSKQAKKLDITKKLLWQSAFFADDFYIDALVASVSPRLNQKKPDFVLFSYHGLPVRQLEKSGADCQGCDREGPCPKLSLANARCYRAQCYATTQAVISHLKLSDDRYMVSFQSRLGRIPWLQPYTDQLLPKLYQSGVRRLMVICPSFVVDCLETLEEIAIRASAQWKALGGESLELVPCLNDHPSWIEKFSAALKQQLSLVIE